MILDRLPPIRRKSVFLLIVDIGGSNNDPLYMSQITNIIEDIQHHAVELDANQTTYDIMIDVLLMGIGVEGTDCRWMYESPVPISEFTWTEIINCGWTPMARAFEELDEKLSRQYFLRSESGNGSPTCILISDGSPCTPSGDDLDSTFEALKKLKKNRWFLNSNRVSITVSDSPNREILLEFAGSESNLLKQGDNLEDLIEPRVIMTSAMIQKTILVEEPAQNSTETQPNKSPDWNF